MENNFKMLAKTFFGMEKILADELNKLGATEVYKGNRLVHFSGDKGFMYKANLCLRTALKILKPFYHFYANSDSQLYNQLYKFDWGCVLSPDQSFAIDSVVNGEIFKHSLYASQRCKDAIVDSLVKNYGKRPSVNKIDPDIHFHLHINHKKCSISLDTSGSSLHHRGYRTLTNISPINEVLAAGIIYLSNWDKKTDFIDPMCGSGTFLIEAAMMASNIPANINRSKFNFQKWNDWDKKLFKKIRDSQLKRVISPYGKIYGFDKAPSAVEKSKINIKNASLGDFIKVERANVLNSKKINESKLHLLTNPPYGERLNGNINDLYKNFGSTLKHNYHNTNAWLISSNFEALKHIGLRPSRKIKLFNGKLETRLCLFNIYQGTKKVNKEKNKKYNSSKD